MICNIVLIDSFCQKQLPNFQCFSILLPCILCARTTLKHNAAAVLRSGYTIHLAAFRFPGGTTLDRYRRFNGTIFVGNLRAVSRIFVVNGPVHTPSFAIQHFIERIESDQGSCSFEQNFANLVFLLCVEIDRYHFPAGTRHSRAFSPRPIL